MATLWFGIVAVMIAVYVVLDGFDFGAGILHLFVAKNDAERRTVLASIGPFWDGNEVWLLAGGGVLVFSFPRAYAAGFSGFYLPLMMVLWLLLLRGISIEFRSLEKASLWRSFWDGVFFLASSLMAIVLGAALGNVIRGVPLNSEGYFSGPLFTDFMPGKNPGVLDWYTVLIGLFAFAVLTLHGALYLNYRTDGEVQRRSQRAASALWGVVIVLGIAATAATQAVQPSLYANLIARPWTWILAAGVAIGIAGIPVLLRRGREWQAFIASCAFIISMLAATAAGVYPVLLRSTIDEANDITVVNGTAGQLSLSVGLAWWIGAMVLALAYFIHLFRSFRGKASPDAEGYGH